MNNSNMSNFMKNWQLVDSLEQPDKHIEFLKLAQESPQFQKMRAEICQVLEPIQGTGIDVGCGLGLAAQELTAGGWQVTGIDLSQTMINEARKRYPGLDFRVGSALDLPFGDSSLDFYRAERVYVTLPKDQIEPALAEAYRVLKTGGMIILAEPDLDTMVFTCNKANKPLARTAIRAMAETHQNGNAGSDMRGHLIRKGFVDITVTGCAPVFTELTLANPLALDIAFEVALANGYLSQEQIEALRQDVTEHWRRGEFQCSYTAFIISGRRPLEK